MTSFNLIVLTLVSLFVNTYSAIEEGNILLPMTSNFVLQHKQNQINNKNYYTIQIKIGSEEQLFEVQVDTSTSTTWLPSVKCKNCRGTEVKYDEEESSSCSPTDEEITLEDEDGNVKGLAISDSLILGDFRLKEYGFVQVTQLGQNFKDHFEGKLGLGYKSILSNSEFNLLDKLKYYNIIKKRIFSINEINESTGMLYIGDTPGKEYKTYCNVLKNTENLDEMYRESWICQITHTGSFYFVGGGVSNKLDDYDEIENNRYVNFDSAYDYISVPISEKKVLENLFSEAELQCGTTEDLNKESKKENEEGLEGENSLRNRIKEKTISISCKTSPQELIEKCMSWSFVIQGHVYSIPLEDLFVPTHEDGEMEMLVKIIDDDNAIWTFGYPFMNEFLMIFNREDSHVGIKRLKKTFLPIVSVKEEWEKWKTNNLEEETVEEQKEEKVHFKSNNESGSSGGKTFGILLLIAIIAAVVYYVIKTFKGKKLNSNDPAFTQNEQSNDKVY